MSSMYSYVKISIIILLGIVITMQILKSSQQSGIQTALEWSRLAPLPKDVIILTYKVTGNIHTHGCRFSFRTSKRSLLLWMNSSPGLQTAKIIQPNNHDCYVSITDNASIFVKKHKNTYYCIAPELNINHAEALIDKVNGFVSIYVYMN